VRYVFSRHPKRHRFDLTPEGPYKGAVSIADVETPQFGTVTAISVYGLMNPLYAQTTIFRVVADLIPLFDSPRRGRRHFVLGGDINAHTQTEDRSSLPRYKAMFAAIESLGLRNCFKDTVYKREKLQGCPCQEPECFHVQTHRHPAHRGTRLETVGGHNDYLFASPDLADRLVACYAVGASDETVWQLSDHCPVVAVFNLA